MAEVLNKILLYFLIKCFICNDFLIFKEFSINKIIILQYKLYYNYYLHCQRKRIT